jgi:hypothetical protein
MREGAPCRIDRVVDVARIAGGDLRIGLRGGGVEHVEPAAARRFADSPSIQCVRRIAVAYSDLVRPPSTGTLMPLT